VISVIRLTTLRAALTDTDATWTMFPTCLWTMAEAVCAIICVSVPTLRPLVDRSCVLWRRPSSKANEINKRKESRRVLKRPQIYGTGLETGASIQFPVTSGDDNQRAEVVCNRELLNPEPCHLSDHTSQPGILNII
jgi:hypothetical protein